jgi:hypothetical protein
MMTVTEFGRMWKKEFVVILGYFSSISLSGLKETMIDFNQDSLSPTQK